MPSFDNVIYNGSNNISAKDLKQKEKQEKKGIEQSGKDLNKYLSDTEKSINENIKIGENAVKELNKTAKKDKPTVVFPSDKKTDTTSHIPEEYKQSVNETLRRNVDVQDKLKNIIRTGENVDDIYNKIKETFSGDDLTTAINYIENTDENSDTDFSISDDDRTKLLDRFKDIKSEKISEVLSATGNKPQKQEQTGGGGVVEEKKKEEPKVEEKTTKTNFFETDPSLLKRANAIRSKWEKEMKTPHQFYSRIFSVPEWFPKGLDEFREKKKELTDKPVYDKKSGKYVRNTTGEMATAKAEQKMAEDALSGMEDELRKMYVGISDIQKEQKQADKAMKEAEEIGKENYKEYVKDVIQDKNRKTEPVFVKDKEDFINEAKIDAGLATYDPTTGETHSYDENKKTTKELIQDQKAAIDAIKNGDLKDANEAVDNLKEEYRAAKRKLIKENAGNIARNVWFIIDLVTTMNRNAARLMPQGKYSPNLGNFETPALFQDYAAQLQNMRDAYNKVNTERSMADIEADKREMSNIFNVDEKMMSLIPEEYRNELTLKLNKGNAEIEKDLARLRAALNVDVTDEIANRALFRFYLTEPDIVAKMNTKQIKDFWNVARMKAEGYDDIALNSFKEQLNEQLQKGNTREAAAMIERLAKNTLDYKVATPEQLKTLRTIQNIRSGVGVVGDAVGTIKDAVSIFSPIPITAAGATQ